MSPASLERARVGVAFVEANFVSNPEASRAYVREARAEAIAKLSAAETGRERRIAYAFALGTLQAEAALDELEQGANGAAFTYGDDLAARIAEFKAATS